MVLLKVFPGQSSEGQEGLGVGRLSPLCPAVASLQCEVCYYVEVDGHHAGNKGGEEEEVWGALGQEGGRRLWEVIRNPWDDHHFSTTSSFPTDATSSDMHTIIEIGPRLTFSTAWSTNAVSILRWAGVQRVARVERVRRYLVRFTKPYDTATRTTVVAGLHDPMTEQEYKQPFTSFQQDTKPQQWRPVDVLGEGRRAMEEVSQDMGLGFDGWDLDYYTDLFINKVQRNPTTVELFDLAQSNSEHSRHWFFKGKYRLGGELLPRSLLDMVIATNSASSTTNPNNVIAFSDNSSGIKGWEVPVLVPQDPSAPSQLTVQPRLRHIIFTAETHNFPTGVAPFSGAATGTGGRIRDIQGAGRGGHVVAGTAGYCFGNLHIPGYDLPWETPSAHYPANFALPLEVAIQASNGASDYGNKFGEPVISGFARSFGQVVGERDGERREWIKPIMFSGGVGSLEDSLVHKCPPKAGYYVVKVGGPAYRIGVGGGAASSIQVQGDGAAWRDLGAVQRGDPEMEQKMNRVVRGCVEAASYPILAIHDQGAGGNANVLKELVEGAGGVVVSGNIQLGDPSLSTLEVWGAEYQESNALLLHPSHWPFLTKLAARERCPVQVVGLVTGDHKIRLIEDKMEVEEMIMEQVEERVKGAGALPVDLCLDWVLGNMPQKEFEWSRERVLPEPLSLGEEVGVMEALGRVLRLPSVASKRYLTNKVDRSVTGLVAQQQCVGPLLTPLADVAVTAASYFSKKGAATSIGEQPVKLLVDPGAGARLTLLEALANLASAPLSSLKDVKCSVNWMWPAKLPGEGWQMYQGCEALCEAMGVLGVAADGGKDSLSMAARLQDGTVVKAPGALVVSAYAPCTDITKVVTPDLKSPGTGRVGTVVWVRVVVEQARLGGSALAQVYSQLGRDSPDAAPHHLTTFTAAFTLLQQMIEEGLVLALHDVSDGGLVTCLLEMCIAGWGGATLDLPPPPAPPPSATDNVAPTLSALFSEEVGWVMEVEQQHGAAVVGRLVEAGVVGACVLGSTTLPGPQAKIEVSLAGKEVFSLTVVEAARMWEETSYQLEKLQADPDCVEQEYQSLSDCTHTASHIPFTYKDYVLGPETSVGVSVVRAAVVREEGSNGDREMASALLQAGFTVHDLTMTDLLGGAASLHTFRGLAFPGGFSYADVLGPGVGWAGVVRGDAGRWEELEQWRRRPDTFSLGVCNGCQLMALLGWLDPPHHSEPSSCAVRLVSNVSGRFESRWSRVQVETSKSVLLQGMEGARLGVWVAHGAGRFVYRSEEVQAAVGGGGCVALRYLDHQDQPTQAYPHNPNGSQDGVAGLTSACGRHLALMPHPERSVLSWQWPQPPPPSSQFLSTPVAPWSRLFQNAFDWCLENKQ